jgi:hypothetical protein
MNLYVSCADAKFITVISNKAASLVDDKRNIDSFEELKIWIYSQSHFERTFGTVGGYPPIIEIVRGVSYAVTDFDELDEGGIYVAFSLPLQVESIENYILIQNSDFEKKVRVPL